MSQRARHATYRYLAVAMSRCCPVARRTEPPFGAGLNVDVNKKV
jgi:hypothetical protein